FGVTILAAVQLFYLRGYILRETRYLRQLKPTRRNDYVIRFVLALARINPIAAAWIPVNGDYTNTTLYRRIETPAILFKVSHNICARHKAIRVTTIVVSARQLDRPVGGHECEAIPSPAAPGFTNVALLKYK